MSKLPQFATGDGILTVLCDGTDHLPLDLLLNLDRTNSAPYLTQALDGRIEIPINTFLYQTRDRNILIDGGGAGLAPGLGVLPQNLDTMGITPSQIDTLYCTHLHPDHIGGLLQNGAPVFANATLRIHHAEPDFWQDTALGENAPPQFQAMIDGARAVLDAYAGQIEVFSNGDKIGPGAVAVHLPGHTPGHCGLQLGTAETAILIWADIVHIAAVQLALPDTSIVFDADPALAAATRKRLLDQIADTDLHIAGGHVPGIGQIQRGPQGFVFRPTVEQATSKRL